MKIDVITVEQAKFKKWRWWSNWIDVAVYNYSYRPWLVQMKVSRTNAKAFRSVCITGHFYKQTNSEVIGDLTQMSKNI